MKNKFDAYGMTVFPLFALVGLTIMILGYLIAAETLFPETQRSRLYVNTAYGVSG